MGRPGYAAKDVDAGISQLIQRHREGCSGRLRSRGVGAARALGVTRGRGRAGVVPGESGRAGWGCSPRLSTSFIEALRRLSRAIRRSAKCWRRAATSQNNMRTLKDVVVTHRAAREPGIKLLE